MAFTISKQQMPFNEMYLHSPGFRRLLEDHLPILRNSDATARIDIPPNLEYKYIGDFYGLLLAMGIGNDFLWITMRVNGYLSTIAYSGEVKTLMVPSTEYIYELLARYRSVTTVS